MPLSICIAGCGNYARRVLDEIHDMRETVTLYFASRDGARARQYNDTYGGAGFFTSYEEAARDHRVEAMYLFFPHHLHLEGTRLAASHSKHVLVEKPIARTIPEASELIAAARYAGVVLMVAENYRFAYAVDKCKELMAEGLIGDTRLIRSHVYENAAVPQCTVRRDIKGQDATVRAELAVGLTFKVGFLCSANGHIQSSLVGRERQPVRVYALVGGQMYLSARVYSEHSGNVHLPQRRFQPQ